MTDLEKGHFVSYTNVESNIEIYTLVPAAPSAWETSAPPPGPPPPSLSSAESTMAASSVPSLLPLFSSDESQTEQSSVPLSLSPLPSKRKRSALAALSSNLPPSPSKNAFGISSSSPKRPRLEPLAAPASAPETSGLWRADLPFAGLDDDEFEALVQSHNVAVDAAIEAENAAGKIRAAELSRIKANANQNARRAAKRALRDMS
ncbi:hypothetical protein VTL71DRAFT_8440 [Oculimacula yallundae]|uniref:Uncharacterized protein n=1 Tax=Oculimacula yallundae TaxID=86028 RepID=A0ABR4CYT2_9HELO